MPRCLLFCGLFALGLCAAHAEAVVTPELVVNGGAESGLAGWTSGGSRSYQLIMSVPANDRMGSVGQRYFSRNYWAAWLTQEVSLAPYIHEIRNGNAAARFSGVLGAPTREPVWVTFDFCPATGPCVEAAHFESDTYDGRLHELVLCRVPANAEKLKVKIQFAYPRWWSHSGIVDAVSATLTLAPRAAVDTNLVMGPGAESAQAACFWTHDLNTIGTSSASVLGRQGSRVYYGGGSAAAKGHQWISVARDAVAVGQGLRSLSIAGLIGGTGSTTGDVAVRVEQWTADRGAVLRSVTLDTITAADRGGAAKLVQVTGGDCEVDPMTGHLKLVVEFAHGGYLDELDVRLVPRIARPVFGVGANLIWMGGGQGISWPCVWGREVGAPATVASADFAGSDGAVVIGALEGRSTTRVHQWIDVSSDMAAIDAGGRVLQIAALVGGVGGAAGTAAVRAEAWTNNTGGALLATVGLPSVSPAERNNEGRLMPREDGLCALPVMTRWVRVVVEVLAASAADRGALDRLDVRVLPRRPSPPVDLSLNLLRGADGETAPWTCEWAPQGSSPPMERVAAAAAGQQGGHVLTGFSQYATGTAAVVQWVNVSHFAAEIDNGKRRAVLSGLLGGQGALATPATVEVAMFDAAKAVRLGRSATIGPVSAAERGSAAALLEQAASVGIPAGARFARVTVTVGPGPFGSTFVDGLSLAIELPTATATSTTTPTRMSSPSATSTRTATPPGSASPTASHTAHATTTQTSALTASNNPPRTVTGSTTASGVATATASPAPTPSQTMPSTVTATATVPPSSTPSVSATARRTRTSTGAITASLSRSVTSSLALTLSVSKVSSGSVSVSHPVTLSGTVPRTATASRSWTLMPTQSTSRAMTATVTHAATATQHVTASATASLSASRVGTPSMSLAHTASCSAVLSASATLLQSTSTTATATQSASTLVSVSVGTATATLAHSASASLSVSVSARSATATAAPSLSTSAVQTATTSVSKSPLRWSTTESRAPTASLTGTASSSFTITAALSASGARTSVTKTTEATSTDAATRTALPTSTTSKPPSATTAITGTMSGTASLDVSITASRPRTGSVAPLRTTTVSRLRTVTMHRGSATVTGAATLTESASLQGTKTVTGTVSVTPTPAVEDDPLVPATPVPAPQAPLSVRRTLSAIFGAADAAACPAAPLFAGTYFGATAAVCAAACLVAFVVGPRIESGESLERQCHSAVSAASHHGDTASDTTIAGTECTERDFAGSAASLLTSALRHHAWAGLVMPCSWARCFHCHAAVWASHVALVVAFAAALTDTSYGLWATLPAACLLGALSAAAATALQPLFAVGWTVTRLRPPPVLRGHLTTTKGKSFQDLVEFGARRQPDVIGVSSATLAKLSVLDVAASSHAVAVDNEHCDCECPGSARADPCDSCVDLPPEGHVVEMGPVFACSITALDTTASSRRTFSVSGTSGRRGVEDPVPHGWARRAAAAAAVLCVVGCGVLATMLVARWCHGDGTRPRMFAWAVGAAVALDVVVLQPLYCGVIVVRRALLTDGGRMTTLPHLY